jgi:RNA polymerase sigma-70 factor (ECF subfamily)
VTLTEDTLIEGARRGDNDAIAQLFDRHWRDAWRIAHGIVLAAIQALGSFDGRRPFRAWLHRIVVNRSIDAVRRDKRLVRLDDAPDIAVDDHPADPMLAAAIRRLELDRRAVIVLRYGLEMTPPEIAVTLDIPVGTVHSRLARGLEDLRTQLEAHVG